MFPDGIISPSFPADALLDDRPRSSVRWRHLAVTRKQKTSSVVLHIHLIRMRGPCCPNDSGTVGLGRVVVCRWTCVLASGVKVETEATFPTTPGLLIEFQTLDCVPPLQPTSLSKRRFVCSGYSQQAPESRSSAT